MKLLAANRAVGRGDRCIAASVICTPALDRERAVKHERLRQAGLVDERPSGSRRRGRRPSAPSTGRTGPPCRGGRARRGAGRARARRPPSPRGRRQRRPPAGRRSTSTSGTPRSRHSADRPCPGTGGGHQQAVDLSLQEGLDQPLLLVVALVAVGQDHRDPRLARRGLDAVRQRREERVRDVRQERGRSCPSGGHEGCGRGCWAGSRSRQAPLRHGPAAWGSPPRSRSRPATRSSARPRLAWPRPAGWAWP